MKYFTVSASAAESLVCPYFQEIINQFREYLVVTEGNEEMFKLQIQAIGMLSLLDILKGLLQILAL